MIIMRTINCKTKFRVHVDFLKTFICLFLFLGFSLPALAQTAQSDELRLTTSPLPINLKVTPGSSVTATLKLKNEGIKTENIKVSLMKFKADPINGATQLMDREQGDNYFDWVTFSENNFQLPVNEWKNVTATFNVPATAAFDYYYAVVFSRADQPAPAGDRQTVLTGALATLVLLEVDVPNAKREVQITDFSVDKNMFEFLPATFTVKLKNTGNVHVVPKGNIFISRGDNKDVAILDVNETQGSILPDSPRNFQPQWSDGFPYYIQKQQDGKVVMDAKGNPMQELKWNWADASKLRWGKYTAKLLMVYDNGQRDVPLEAEVSFWVVPWRLIGAGLIVLIFVIIGLKSTLQNIWKKIRKIFEKSK
jgi:hypothetical protein